MQYAGSGIDKYFSLPESFAQQRENPNFAVCLEEIFKKPIDFKILGAEAWNGGMCLAEVEVVQ